MSTPVLHVVIVGAGLGGLAAAIGIQRAGHTVTILEQSAEFHHVGAGIQIPPNSSRILSAWNLIPQIAAHSENPLALRLRRWQDGRILSSTSRQFKARYGHEIYYIHRADFHRVLADAARDLGVVFRLGATVQDIDFGAPSVRLKSGEVVNADVVIGADGLNSVTKEVLLGKKVPPLPTGDLAYRLVVRAEDMRRHDILRELIENTYNDVWMGPRTFVVGYLLQGDGFYNIVLVCPDTDPAAADVSKATPEEMRELLEGWDPRLQALLGVVQQTQKWRMLTSEEMEEWGHEGGRFVLLGDACHASLPYLAQGAAMAVEDGAVLGALFAKIKEPVQIAKMLKLYEELRKPRTTKIVKGSLDQGVLCKLPDGELQEERDRKGVPIHITDPVFQRWMMGHDCVDEAEKAWEEHFGDGNS